MNADVCRRLVQLKPAVATANRFHHAGQTQLMHHFHQMISGDPMQLGDVLDRDQPILVEAQMHQGAQRVVGVGG